MSREGVRQTRPVPVAPAEAVTTPRGDKLVAQIPERGQILLQPGRSGKPPRHLVDMTAEERDTAVAELGQKPFRGKQVAAQYFGRLQRNCAQMTDIPAGVREQLGEALLPQLLTPMRTVLADGGDTVKAVWRLFDGALVESVLMVYPDRATVCVSSQAGCGMNCPFCATGQAGLTRNMSVGEVVDQVVAASVYLAEHGGDVDDDGSTGDGGGAAASRVTNVVFMGMGEPLANYKVVVQALRALTAPPPDGLGMSARNITVSTVGLVPAMKRLAQEQLPVTLALSLHAPDDELRSELVPVNTRWSVAEALDAAREYFDATGRRVSIEYALIRDMNDQSWRARKLAQELTARGRGWVHINPIPLNPTPGSVWTASDPGVQDTFVQILREAGIRTTVRDTRGQDIDGACGQLAASTSGERQEENR